jgi:hypothetical protein
MNKEKQYDEIDEAIAQLWLAVGNLLEENKLLKEMIKEIKNEN